MVVKISVILLKDCLVQVKCILDRKTLEKIYITFTRPILEYGDVVWGNKTLLLIKKLENVQIEAARIVTGGTRLVCINGLYKETGWETQQARREHHKNNIYYFLPSTVRLRKSEPTSIRDCRSPSYLKFYCKSKGIAKFIITQELKLDKYFT